MKCKQVALQTQLVHFHPIQGSLDLILSASKSARRKPPLRSEEAMVRREWRDREAGEGKNNSVLGKGSITEQMTFSKILRHNVPIQMFSCQKSLQHQKEKRKSETLIHPIVLTLLRG